MMGWKVGSLAKRLCEKGFDDARHEPKRENQREKGGGYTRSGSEEIKVKSSRGRQAHCIIRRAIGM